MIRKFLNLRQTAKLNLNAIDKNKYAIVSKDEIELDGFKDHYQTGEFEVYYFGEDK